MLQGCKRGRRTSHMHCHTQHSKVFIYTTMSNYAIMHLYTLPAHERLPLAPCLKTRRQAHESVTRGPPVADFAILGPFFFSLKRRCTQEALSQEALSQEALSQEAHESVTRGLPVADFAIMGPFSLF